VKTRREYIPVGSTVAIQATDGLHTRAVHSLLTALWDLRINRLTAPPAASTARRLK